VSLKHGPPEQTLDFIRRAIDDALESLCADLCGNAFYQNKQRDHVQLESSICNHGADCCNSPAHKTDHNYDHVQRKSCKARRNIMLLLSGEK
jgi:hypothetical protein